MRDWFLTKFRDTCEAISDSRQWNRPVFAWDGAAWVCLWRTRDGGSVWDVAISIEPDEDDSGAYFRVRASAENESGGPWSREYYGRYLTEAQMDAGGPEAFLNSQVLAQLIERARSESKEASLETRPSKAEVMERIRRDLGLPKK